MINPIILEILKRKIASGEIKIEDIKNLEYRAEIEKVVVSE